MNNIMTTIIAYTVFKSIQSSMLDISYFDGYINDNFMGYI